MGVVTMLTFETWGYERDTFLISYYLSLACEVNGSNTTNMSAYTTAAKVQIITWYLGGNSLEDCVNLFIAAYENRPSPSRTTIHRIVMHFKKWGCIVDCKKCHRNETPQAQENDEIERRDVMVCSALAEDDTKSTREVAEELGTVSHTTVNKIWRKNGLKCYRYEKTQEILPEDNIRRMEFCEAVMEKANHDEQFIENILFTDESSFPLHGKHNSSIMRYWSEENQHRSVALRTQFPQKVNVWTGILGRHVVGPFFIEGNLNAVKYLRLLQTRVLPTITALPDINMDRIWFQQDGCPAHNAHQVRVFLENTFPERIIAGFGTIRWPPRSPDLSPNDFFYGVI